jgi:hypothetical protein
MIYIPNVNDYIKRISTESEFPYYEETPLNIQVLIQKPITKVSFSFHSKLNRFSEFRSFIRKYSLSGLSIYDCSTYWAPASVLEEHFQAVKSIVQEFVEMEIDDLIEDLCWRFQAEKEEVWNWIGHS